MLVSIDNALYGNGSTRLYRADFSDTSNVGSGGTTRSFGSQEIGYVACAGWTSSGSVNWNVTVGSSSVASFSTPFPDGVWMVGFTPRNASSVRVSRSPSGGVSYLAAGRALDLENGVNDVDAGHVIAGLRSNRRVSPSLDNAAGPTAYVRRRYTPKQSLRIRNLPANAAADYDDLLVETYRTGVFFLSRDGTGGGPTDEYHAGWLVAPEVRFARGQRATLVDMTLTGPVRAGGDP